MQQNEIEAIKAKCEEIKNHIPYSTLETDAIHIASEIIPKLLDEIDRLQKENEQLKNELDMAVEDIKYLGNTLCEYDFSACSKVCIHGENCKSKDNFIWRGEAQNEDC